MRVLYCYTSVASPLALAALAGCSPEFVRTSDPWEEVGKRWGGESSLVLVGQDTELHDCVLREFENCSSPICIFFCENGPHGTHCVKFSAAVQASRSVLEVQLNPGKVCLHEPAVVCGREGLPEVSSVHAGDTGFAGEKF